MEKTSNQDIITKYQDTKNKIFCLILKFYCIKKSVSFRKNLNRFLGSNSVMDFCWSS
jgi:hypothetical protein